MQLNNYIKYQLNTFIVFINQQEGHTQLNNFHYNIFFSGIKIESHMSDQMNSQHNLTLHISIEQNKTQYMIDGYYDDTPLQVINILRQQYNLIDVDSISPNKLFAYYDNILIQTDQPLRTLIKRHKITQKTIKLTIYNQRQKQLENAQAKNKNLGLYQIEKKETSISHQKKIEKSKSKPNFQSKIQKQVNNARIIVNKWAQPISLSSGQINNLLVKKEGNYSAEANKSSTQNKIEFKVHIKVTNLDRHQQLEVAGLYANNTLEEAIQKVKLDVQDLEDAEFTYALGQRTIKREFLKEKLLKCSAKKKTYNEKQYFEVQLTMAAKYPGG